jgi:hypothetical protein
VVWIRRLALLLYYKHPPFLPSLTHAPISPARAFSVEWWWCGVAARGTATQRAGPHRDRGARREGRAARPKGRGQSMARPRGTGTAARSRVHARDLPLGLRGVGSRAPTWPPPPPTSRQQPRWLAHAARGRPFHPTRARRAAVARRRSPTLTGGLGAALRRYHTSGWWRWSRPRPRPGGRTDEARHAGREAVLLCAPLLWSTVCGPFGNPLPLAFR